MQRDEMLRRTDGELREGRSVASRNADINVDGERIQKLLEQIEAFPTREQRS